MQTAHAMLPLVLFVFDLGIELLEFRTWAFWWPKLPAFHCVQGTPGGFPFVCATDQPSIPSPLGSDAQRFDSGFILIELFRIRILLSNLLTLLRESLLNASSLSTNPAPQDSFAGKITSNVSHNT